MKNQLSNNLVKSTAALFLGLILSFNFSCAGISQSERDYSKKRFDSQEWLAGDAIERGRMTLDAYKKRIPNKKSKEEIIKLFGEPDKKATVEGREVWLYQTENKFQTRLNLFPISFDNKKGAFVGGVKGDTFSIFVDEEWAK